MFIDICLWLAVGFFILWFPSFLAMVLTGSHCPDYVIHWFLGTVIGGFGCLLLAAMGWWYTHAPWLTVATGVE